MEPESRLKERDLEGLRSVLNDWDPIGVYSGPDGPEDDGEYDCLRWPLVARLQRGASRQELAGFLQEELTQHFGLGGKVTDDDPVLDRLLAWWKATGVP